MFFMNMVVSEEMECIASKAIILLIKIFTGHNDDTQTWSSVQSFKKRETLHNPEIFIKNLQEIM